MCHFYLFLFSPILHVTSLLQAVNAARHYGAEFGAAFQRGSVTSALAVMEFIGAQHKLIHDVAVTFFTVVYQREATEAAVFGKNNL